MTNAPFKRPRRSVSRFGDPRRTWRHESGAGAVVETVTCGGVAVRRTRAGEPLPVYHAVLIGDGAECLVSVHRKLRPALAAVVRALKPKPKRSKRR